MGTCAWDEYLENIQGGQELLPNVLHIWSQAEGDLNVHHVWGYAGHHAEGMDGEKGERMLLFQINSFMGSGRRWETKGGVWL